jgi:hypothetical protein
VGIAFNYSSLLNDPDGREMKERFNASQPSDDVASFSKPISDFSEKMTTVYKLALGVVILATMAWAQANSAGCGPDQTKFEVKREAHSHPTGTPEPGKILRGCL